MKFENSKICEVIEDFKKIRDKDAVFFYKFINKAFEHILKWDDLSIPQSDLFSLLLDVLKKMAEDPSREKWGFDLINSGEGKNYQCVDIREEDKNQLKVIIGKSELDDFIKQNNLSFLEEGEALKELRVLAVVADFIQQIKPVKKTSEENNEKLSKDIDKSIVQESNIGGISQGFTKEEIINKTFYDEINKYAPFKSLCLSYVYSHPEFISWRKGTFMQINLDIFGKLIWSILNAEFLELDNYSDKLEECITRDMKHYDPGDLENFVIPYIYQSLTNLFYLMIERCRIVLHMFDDKDNKQKDFINISTADDITFARQKYVGYDETINFEHLVRSLCHLTDIDLVYVTNKANIQRLTKAFRLATIMSWEIKEDSERASFKDALEIIKVKASILLYDMLEQPMPKDPQIRLQYFVSEMSIVKGLYEIYTTYCSSSDEKDSESTQGANPLLELWGSFKGKEFDPEKDLNLKKPSKFTIKETDIDRYSGFAYSGIECDSKLSSIISLLSSYLKESKEVDEPTFDEVAKKIKKSLEDNISTSSFLYRAILFMFKNKEYWKPDSATKSEEPKNYAALANNLISKLRDYLDVYSDGNRPRYAFRPTFEYSFYEINNKKMVFAPINTKEPTSFFFASYTLTPFNPRYLERFHQKYLAELQNYTQDLNMSLQKQTYALVENFQSHTAELDDKSNAINTLKEDMVNKQHEERKNTVQVLGVFAALLAFVSMSIGMVKVAKNPAEFALFCCAFGGAILLLVLAIKAIIHSHEISKEQKVRLRLLRKNKKFCKQWHLRAYYSVSVGERKIIIGLLFLLAVCIFIVLVSRSIRWGEVEEENSPLQKQETTIFNQSSIDIEQNIRNVKKSILGDKIMTNEDNSNSTCSSTEAQHFSSVQINESEGENQPTTVSKNVSDTTSMVN